MTDGQFVKVDRGHRGLRRPRTEGVAALTQATAASSWADLSQLRAQLMILGPAPGKRCRPMPGWL